jgi:hypothetical protein
MSRHHDNISLYLETPRLASEEISLLAWALDPQAATTEKRNLA